MDRLKSRLIVITGASSGLGEACALAFAREECRLLLAARRADRLAEVARRCLAGGAPAVRTLVLDVRDGPAVRQAFDSLPIEWRDVEVLINNAGLSRGLGPLQAGSVADWDEMIDTNIKGLLHIDRAVVPWLVERGSGTVIHVGSIAGRQVYPGGNVYCATKHAVAALTEALRLDLSGTGVRVATVDPGLVETEFSLVRFHGDAERAKSPYRGMTPLRAADVAEVVLFIVSRPAHVTIAEVLVLPTDQASASQIHRRTNAMPQSPPSHRGEPTA